MDARCRSGLAVVAGVALAVVGLAGCGGSSGPSASAVSPGPVQTTDPAGTNYSYPPVASFGPGSDVTFDSSSPAPNDPVATPAAPEPPEQVTYHCSGSASDGVDITYGPNGSSHSASRLPFNHVEPLTDGALYYAVSAQLQGGGSVSCTLTVQVDNLLDGSADDTSNSGSADGGYNIASAQVCSASGGWEKC